MRKVRQYPAELSRGTSGASTNFRCSFALFTLKVFLCAVSGFNFRLNFAVCCVSFLDKRKLPAKRRPLIKAGIEAASA